MKRLVFIPLLLFTLSMACMAQTFQYSRGWTNGKRSSSLSKAQQEHQRYFTTHQDNPIDPELFEENMVERYFLELPRFMRNALLARTLRPTSTDSNSRNVLENRNNNAYGNHHQSNELFDDLNGVGAVDSNDFGKH